MTTTITVPWNEESEQEIAQLNNQLLVDVLNKKISSNTGLLVYKVMPIYRWNVNSRTIKWKDPIYDMNRKLMGYEDKVSEVVGRIPTGIIGERRKTKYGTETVMYDRPKKVPLEIKKNYMSDTH